MIEPARQKGKTKKLEELIINNIQNDGEILYVEAKDSDVVSRIVEHAKKNGRSLDIHVVDFLNNQPGHSSTINLESGEITVTIDSKEKT